MSILWSDQQKKTGNHKKENTIERKFRTSNFKQDFVSQLLFYYHSFIFSPFFIPKWEKWNWRRSVSIVLFVLFFLSPQPSQISLFSLILFTFSSTLGGINQKKKWLDSTVWMDTFSQSYLFAHNYHDVSIFFLSRLDSAVSKVCIGFYG